VVALNFSGEEKELDLSGISPGPVLLSTHLDREGPVGDGPFRLRGDEGVVIRTNGGV
jgi:hypothetical protein